MEHDTTGVYNKKVSGSSRNVNTFAVDLKQLIEKYETRLHDVAVTMSYIREHKKIYIVVKGTLSETGGEYKYQNTLDIWA
jgi:predicted component of type VI protein secretion system